MSVCEFLNAYKYTCMMDWGAVFSKNIQNYMFDQWVYNCVQYVCVFVCVCVWLYRTHTDIEIVKYTDMFVKLHMDKDVQYHNMLELLLGNGQGFMAFLPCAELYYVEHYQMGSTLRRYHLQ